MYSDILPENIFRYHSAIFVSVIVYRQVSLQAATWTKHPEVQMKEADWIVCSIKEAIALKKTGSTT